jgi:hypothetical protein
LTADPKTWNHEDGSRIRLLRSLARGIAVVGGTVLLVRGAAGPFWRISNPQTAQTALALSVVAAMLAAGRRGRSAANPSKGSWLTAIAVVLAAAAAFLPVLGMPLVTDDYIHMRLISEGRVPTPIGCLTKSCGGPQFYRPVGFATYWAEWELWGPAAWPRHAFDLLLHVITCLLFLLLIRRLGVTPPFDWLAGLLFAWHAIRPEVVAWPAARFDALALLFALAAGLGVLRGGRWGLVGSCVATAAACLSKESAFALPVLLALLAGRGIVRRSGRLLVGANAAVAAAVFAWRWSVLKGIGGYLRPDGVTPTALEFNALRLAKTFGARIWGVLWVPVNWSLPLEWWAGLGLAACVAGSCLLLGSRPERVRIAACVAGVVAACVPAHHMLLIGPSLDQSRYLDMATPAFVLLLVFGAMGLPRRAGIAALALLAGFHLAALEHNLRIWSDVAKARYQLCRTLAERGRQSGEPITLREVPLLVNGVYWRNGIEDCLQMEFGIPVERVQVFPLGEPAGPRR